MLSLSYLRMLSDELFLKAELNKKISLKTSKKDQEPPKLICLYLLDRSESDQLLPRFSLYRINYYRYFYYTGSTGTNIVTIQDQMVSTSTGIFTIRDRNKKQQYYPVRSNNSDPV